MLQKNDILFAYKALIMPATLSSILKSVAGALIAHYNTKTGQCDPSVSRLAGLLKIEERSVRRATNELCNVYGLFSKVSHGGKNHRAAYTPNWEAFRALVADWEEGAKSGKGPSIDISNRTISSGKEDEMVLFEPDENSLQTRLSNSFKELTAPSGASGGGGCDVQTALKEPPRQSVPVSPNGVRSGSVEQPRRSFERKPAVVVSASHGEAAKAQAMRRIDADLRQLGWQAHGDAAERMTEEISDAAMVAEITHRGGGLRLLIDRLGPSLLRSAVAAGGKS